MSDAALTVSAITKSFGARRALDGVTLTVGRGEMVGLIGPSGSGKSTLLRCLTGLATADRGDVEVLGRPVQSGGRAAKDVRAVRARVGFVFQQFNLVGRLTLFTNAALGMLGRIGWWRSLLGLWPAAERQAVMAALQRVGLAEQAGQRASTLSGGQQQRGAIARALVQRCELLLADEPVASLDPVSGRRVMELIGELSRRSGVTAVVSLHQVDYALRYCPRIVALQQGRIVYDGPREGLDRAALIGIYGPDVEQALGEGRLA